MTQSIRVFQSLERLPVCRRLALSFGIVLVLSAAVGGNALFGLSRVNAASDELASRWLPAVENLQKAGIALLDHVDQVSRIAHVADAGYLPEYEEKMAARRGDLDARLRFYEATSPDGEEKKRLDAFEKAVQNHYAAADNVQRLARAGKQRDALEVFDGAARMSADEAILALDRLRDFDFEGGAAAAAESDRIYRRTFVTAIVMLAIALAAGASFSWLITRGLNRQLGGDPSAAARILQSVARGDLTSRVDVRPGDTHSVMASIAAMQTSLADVVGRVRAGSEQVATASAQIAQGNQDLSSRTEAQAASLQETASSMETLSQTVRTSTENARTANGIAGAASEAATRGGESVRRVVATMDEIAGSSQKMADIINVIDGIAFQTNILALNAAVEAARAGEQGRGFAVVAGEVRNLAQRSAQAAREIKSMIQESIERVNGGNHLAIAAGASMEEIVAQVSRVTDLIGEITGSAVEQSTGIGQINEAVTQMDRSTQQNAALVEQASAAASNLHHQAEDLVSAVAVFRVR